MTLDAPLRVERYTPWHQKHQGSSRIISYGGVVDAGSTVKSNLKLKDRKKD